MALDYEDVVLTTPVSFGYSKFSDNTSTWFAGQVLRNLLAQSGIEKQQSRRTQRIEFLACPGYGAKRRTISWSESEVAR